MITKSETNNAIITRLQNVRSHPNADRLKLATVLGTQVVVDLNSKDNDLVIYFDSNLRLSHEYLHYNNLYSNPELNADTTKKGYFGKNGRVRAQKFRGEVSNGYVAPIHTLMEIPDLKSCTMDSLDLTVGTEFTKLDGVEICSKYFVPTKQNRGQYNPKKPKSTMFHKHWDTKHLMRELNSIPENATCYVEEKIHGTSGRTGRVLVDEEYPINPKIFHHLPLISPPIFNLWKPKKEWKVVSGTRRVDGIDFHLPQIRQEIERRVAPHLRKGETIFYEIYGYDGGKEIQKDYPYDCRPGEWKCMLYRISFVNEDGFSIDLSRQEVYKRAEELGLEKPYLITKIPIDWEGFLVEDKFDWEKFVLPKALGKSNLDVGTLREGIVVWFQDSRGKWDCLKYKNPEFLIDQDKLYEKSEGDPEDNL